MHPSRSRPASPLRVPTLVGRTNEQAVLRQALEDMLAGHGSLMLVSGEAGIGKTTLVEWLARGAGREDCLTFLGHAYDLSVTPPYGPWLEIFRHYRDLASELPPLPDFIFDEKALAGAGSQEVLLATVSDFFAAVAARRPLLLVLDDLHWFDQASLDLLRILARQISEQRILLVATYRSDELHRDHPLYTLLPLMVREAGALRLEVHPLDEDGQRALIDQQYVLSPTDLDRLEHYLFERAEGNPLYAGELLGTLENENVLVRRGEQWELGRLDHVRIPRLLTQVIERRLARLTTVTRELMQVGAVIGQAVPVDLWQAVSQASDTALISAIEEAQAVQLLVDSVDGQSERFRHALLREALYQEVVILRRQRWHRRAAEVLLQAPNPDPDVVAHHLQQAGDQRATEWLIKAGERAQRAYSWVTAIERFEAALALLTKQGAPAGEQALVVFRIAKLSRYADPRRSLTLIRKARELAEDADDVGLAAACRFDEGLYQCFLSELGEGVATMERGLQELDALGNADRNQLASLHEFEDLEFSAGTVVLWLVLSGRLSEAVALGEQRIAAVPPPIPRTGQMGSNYADGWIGLAGAYATLGQPERAKRALTEARSVYQAISHHTQLALTYELELTGIQLAYAADQPAENLRHLAAEGIAALQRASGANSREVPAQLIAFDLLLLWGNWDELKVAASRTYAAGPEARLWGEACEVLVRLAFAQGDAVFANHIIGDFIPAGPTIEPGNANLWGTLILQRLAAQLSLDAGDLPTARAWLEAHDRWLEWSGAVLGRAESARGWAAYHHANGDPSQARARAIESLKHASEPRQPLALLAVHRMLGRLDMVEGRFADAEAHLQQSLQLAEACAAPFERALTLLEKAELRLAQENFDESLACLDEVQALCEPLEARPTLERVATLRHQLIRKPRNASNLPAGLSHREVEVLYLVAAGHTDAEIAERLFVSRRTVTSHMTHIFNKTGTNSRTAAAIWAKEHELL